MVSRNAHLASEGLKETRRGTKTLSWRDGNRYLTKLDIGQAISREEEASRVSGGHEASYGQHPTKTLLAWWVFGGLLGFLNSNFFISLAEIII